MAVTELPSSGAEPAADAYAAAGAQREAAAAGEADGEEGAEECEEEEEEEEPRLKYERLGGGAPALLRGAPAARSPRPRRRCCGLTQSGAGAGSRQRAGRAGDACLSPSRTRHPRTTVMEQRPALSARPTNGTRGSLARGPCRCRGGLRQLRGLTPLRQPAGDPARCVLAGPNVLAVGTLSGAVLLLDAAGNQARSSAPAAPPALPLPSPRLSPVVARRGPGRRRSSGCPRTVAPSTTCRSTPRSNTSPAAATTAPSRRARARRAILTQSAQPMMSRRSPTQTRCGRNASARGDPLGRSMKVRRACAAAS